MVIRATIPTLPETEMDIFGTVDWAVIAQMPFVPDTSFEQIEEQARQSLVENLRAVADAIEARRYSRQGSPDSAG
ncbi:hypothetical protein [Sulfitobacter sp. HI0023]|uniref:hypothetical protein n=2 Tax=Sulfitobacter TaxID=60136 RepID=UPI000AC9C033|nr:hypothetical protein [Sulfitobacter sp. HI0023]